MSLQIISLNIVWYIFEMLFHLGMWQDTRIFFD